MTSCQISKLAQLRFTEWISAEYGDKGVIAYSANPGMHLTDMGARMLPEIVSAPAEQLGELAKRLIDERNFFHGLNPAVLARLWQSEPSLSRAIQSVAIADPWRWNFGVRQYLVTAFRIKKA